MGLRVQSLYHYFASRDQLITELLEDGHNGLADSLEAARDAHPIGARRDRLIATSMMYRDWSVHHRSEFQLIYGAPIPGHQAPPPPSDAPVPAAARIGAVFHSVVFAGWSGEQLRAMPDEHIDPALHAELLATRHRFAPPGRRLPPAALHWFMRWWGQLHGLITLEVFGHLHWLAQDAGRIYRATVLQLADEIEAISPAAAARQRSLEADCSKYGAATPVPRYVMSSHRSGSMVSVLSLGGAVNRSRLLVGVLVALVWLVAACASTPPPLGSGLLLPGYDRGVQAQDDLFQFANGQWLRTTEIAADRSSNGAFVALTDQSEQNLRTIIDESAARRGAAGSPDQQIGDLYASFMDTPRLDALGAAPLKESLDRIDALATPADLARYFGERATTGVPSPIALSINQDAKSALTYIPYVSQSGLTLPNRDYYLKSDPQFVTIRDQLRAYTARLLGLAGVADPDGAAGRVVALENRLAEVQWTAAQDRDATATYNKFTVADATAQAPGLDWAVYLDAAGVDTPDFVVSEPSYFTAVGTALTTVPLADWKSYLKFTLIDDLAPYLSEAFVTARFEFRNRDLAGQQEIRERWKRGVATVNGAVGDLLGQRYVQAYFSPDAKRRMDVLVSKLIDTFRSSIDGLDWMSDPTKVEARDKLDKLVVKISYPNKWKDYSKLRVARDDLVGNLLRSAQLEHQRDVDRLGKPVDREEWFTTPQTVNAFYNPSLNEIVFPAAILQPPFFDATADDAVNYGAIGGIIGHEISHAFDDQGRKYDGTGNLRDWWTPQDLQRFTERTAALTAQYSAYQPLPGEHINGELTLGENIADLSGLAVALRAYRLSLGGQPAAVLDGFTGEQRFFLGWAQAWRGKTRDKALRSQLLSDPHSPHEYRANGVVSNMPEYYAAFNVKEGDKLFRPPDQRVKIW